MIAGENSGQLNAIHMDFVARRFDTFSEVFSITYYDDDGILQEVDLTGANAQMQLKKRKTDAEPFFNMDIAISGNELTVSKYHQQMDLPVGKYWHDIEVKDVDGNHITWIEGRFIVVEHVTEYVDTYITKVWCIIKSVLGISDIPKTFLGTVFQSLLSIVSINIHNLKTVLSAIPGFSTLAFIVKKYTSKFGSILGITDVPKIILSGLFKLGLSFDITLAYNSTGMFYNTVTFFETD